MKRLFLAILLFTGVTMAQQPNQPYMTVAPVGNSVVDFGTLFMGGTPNTETMLLTCVQGPCSLAAHKRATGGENDDITYNDTPCSTTMQTGDTCNPTVTFGPDQDDAICIPCTGTIYYNYKNSANSPATVSYTVSVYTPNPKVVFSTTTLNFGSVQVGNDSPEQVVTVTNPAPMGGATLNVENAVVTTGVAYSIVDSTCVNVVLQGTQSCSFEVIFAPTEPKEQQGVITVTTNDTSTSAPSKVRMSGTGIN